VRITCLLPESIAEFSADFSGVKITRDLPLRGDDDSFCRCRRDYDDQRISCWDTSPHSTGFARRWLRAPGTFADDFSEAIALQRDRVAQESPPLSTIHTRIPSPSRFLGKLTGVESNVAATRSAVSDKR